MVEASLIFSMLSSVQAGTYWDGCELVWSLVSCLVRSLMCLPSPSSKAPLSLLAPLSCVPCFGPPWAWGICEDVLGPKS